MMSESGSIAEQRVICVQLFVGFGDTDAGGGITLRVTVDEQDSQIIGCKRGGEIDRSGSLADAALLIGDRNCFCHKDGKSIVSRIRAFHVEPGSAAFHVEPGSMFHVELR